MRLADLLQELDVLDVQADPEFRVQNITRDSREAGEGVVFVAIRGETIDGHDLVPTVRSGVVVVDHEVESATEVGVVRVHDTRRALSQMTAALHGHPARSVRVVGVTGTNGKTTVCTLVEGALLELELAVGRVGTTGATIRGEAHSTSLTTPESPELQALLAKMRDAGVETCVMEVSSIGVEQGRVLGMAFHLAVFTNLTRDHLDFHGTMEAYGAQKARLFTELLRPAGGRPRALMCIDDPAWATMGAPQDHWTYGFSEGADIRIEEAELRADGMTVLLSTPEGAAMVRSGLVGRHNALNLAAALGVGMLLGVELDQMLYGLSTVRAVAGRLEPVPNDLGAAILVDYAHTPDALAVCLEAVRAVTPGRLWVVFGCGGERDRGKRPEMGAAAERGADRVVLTSDNPRREDAQQIVDDVLLGMDLAPALVDLDRERAIHWAIAQARVGDSVVIAGKGHETYQEIGGERRAFDDREVARRALEAL